MSTDFYKTKDSVEQYIKMAKDVNGQYLIIKLAAFLKPKSTVLEIGSGPGSDWKILNNTYQVTGSDLSDEFLKHLKQNFPQGDFLKLDALTLKTSEKFNALYSNKVLHHLSHKNLIESINRQRDILVPGGIICHSFWQGKGSEIYDGMFVNLHTKNDLKTYFENYFEIILLESYKEFENKDSLLIIAKKRA